MDSSDLSSLTPIQQWLQDQRRKSNLRVERIPWASCKEWKHENGVIAHTSGGFFTVKGLRCSSSPLSSAEYDFPIIDQPEVGLLGYVVKREGDRWLWLLQAKTEPGTVGGTQVGPSVQATQSNYLRRHGGKATLFLELFQRNTTAHASIVSDSEQSEQGDRFLGKYNRNALVRIQGDLPLPDTGVLRWFDSDELLYSLGEGFCINTDSRSVLWCCDWMYLVPGLCDVPFGRWRGKGGFGEALLRSSLVPVHSAEDLSGYHHALRLLHFSRASTQQTVVPIELESMVGWEITDYAIQHREPQGSWHNIQAIQVHTRDREVSEWCQPIVGSTAEQYIYLLCCEKDGVLWFAVSISVEPGFCDVAQLGPSSVSGPCHSQVPEWSLASIESSTETIISTYQSDEGGRFMYSTARYEILRVSSKLMDTEVSNGAWVTLSALRDVGRKRGILNNELRSALSMLLTWC